jgi:hypothetical protein
MSTSNQARVKFAAIQLAVGADKQANLQNARQQIAQAAHNGAKIVALPVRYITDNNLIFLFFFLFFFFLIFHFPIFESDASSS